MNEFLQLLVSFPTVIWTFPMAMIGVYWTLVVLGALGIDLIPFEGGEAGGDGDIDVDSTVSAGPLSESLALGTVPVTVVLSLIVLKGWTLSMLLQGFLGGLLGSFLYGIPFTFGGLLVVFVLSLWLTTLSVRPLRPFFIIHTVTGGASLVGQLVRIESSRVTPTFGIAIYEHPDSSDITLNVVCREGLALAQGDQAVLTDYDQERGVYAVAPLIPTQSQPTPAPAPAPKE